jgi:hypothetical protein
VVANILGSKSKLYHTPKMGRDRVLKKAARELGRVDERDEAILIVVDYERGPYRKYIDENFEKRGIYENKVHIGVFKKDMRLVGIIFDPDIEAFLCKVTNKYCDENEKKALKRRGSDRVCEELQVVLAKVEKVINNIVNELRQQCHIE